MRVEGPCMSLGAHGTIADALTFSMRGGRARAAIYRKPHDAHTQTQLNQRAHYLDATRLWKTMSDADRLAWSQTHQLPNASGFNTFVQTIVNRETRGPSWQHPKFFEQDPALDNFILLHMMENHVDGTFQDISGNARDWSPTDVTQVQADRGQAALLGSSLANHTVDNGANLGNLTELTIALRFYTDTPQGSLAGSVRAIGTYSYGTAAGFLLAFHSDAIRLLIGESGAETSVDGSELYVPSFWNNLVTTFDAGDSGRVRIILNGREIANEETGMSQAANTGQPLYIGATATGTPFPGQFDNIVLYNGISNALRV